MIVSAKSEIALTICSADDLYMRLAAKAAGLIATGARACTSRKMPRPRDSLCPFTQAIIDLPNAPAACPVLAEAWKTAIGSSSDIRIQTVRDYGKEELGLFAKYDLKKGVTVKGPTFTLVPVERDQPGLSTELQFEENFKTWVGCGPSRLVNHSCKPNVQWIKRKRKIIAGYQLMELKVLLPISAGEQLFATYGEYYFGVGYARCQCPHHPDREIPSTSVMPLSRKVIDLTDDDDPECDFEILESVIIPRLPIVPSIIPDFFELLDPDPNLIIIYQPVKPRFDVKDYLLSSARRLKGIPDDAIIHVI